MRSKAPEQGVEIEVLELGRGEVNVFVVGTTPLICNRVSEKAQRELLFPKGKKTAADKAQSLKHEPLSEFLASPYIIPDKSAPTLIAGLATWFKKGMMTAALDLPGTKKAQIGRLVQVLGERVPLYGVPKLLMSITRGADIARTPDVRTRAIIPEWAVPLTIQFASPQLREKSVLNLLAAAGVFAGAGDYRREKGAGNYGGYRLATAEDPELQKIMAQGRKQQVLAMNNPLCYDDETEKLLTWYTAELGARGFTPAVMARRAALAAATTGDDDA